MTQDFSAIAPERAMWRLLLGALPRWKKGVAPLTMAASLFFIPVALHQAEAAGISHTRASSTKVQASQAGKRVVAQSRRTASSPRQATRRTTSAAARQARDPEAEAARRRASVRAALQRAHRATGLDFAVLQRIAERESGFRTDADNPLSSARGLMQFTRDTWLEVVRDFGEKYGLASLAKALDTDREGRITTRDPRIMKRILQLRDDPYLSAVLAAERLKQARAPLEAAIGRTSRPTDLYFVHLLGPTGARRFLKALQDNPRQSSVTVAGAAAKPNPGVFERNGRALPVSKVYEEVAEAFEPREIAAFSIGDPGELSSSTLIVASEK